MSHWQVLVAVVATAATQSRTARPRPHAVGTVSEKHLLIPRDSDILVSFQMHIELSPMDLDISSNLKFSNVRRTFFWWYFFG